MINRVTHHCRTNSGK